MSYSKIKLSRGDIILARVPMPSSELKKFKLRPCLIVSKDFNNLRLDDVIIAICTSNISRSSESTQYLIEGEKISEAGIKVSSVVKSESLLSISKAMIVRVLGKLSNKSIDKINECLKDAIGLV